MTGRQNTTKLKFKIQKRTSIRYRYAAVKLMFIYGRSNTAMNVLTLKKI